MSVGFWEGPGRSLSVERPKIDRAKSAYSVEKHLFEAAIAVYAEGLRVI